MFVVIDMSDEKQRLFEKYRKHEISLKRYDVRSATPFFVAKCHKKYTDFNELKRIINRYGVALFDEKTEIPELLKELAFEPSVLPLKMLVRTVSEYFAGQKSRCDLSVAVIDVSAKVCDVLPLLARQVRYVRVITSRADKYDLCADTIYKTLGISVEISDDLISAASCDIIISVDDKQSDFFTDAKIICYNKTTQKSNVFSLKDSQISYDKFDCDKYGINKFTFICALYETCGYHLKEIPVFKDISTIDKALKT